MFDALTIAALADEFGDVLLNGRIQKIGLIDRLTIGAEVYAQRRRRWLIASADSARPRILMSSVAPSLDPSQITPFGLLLRKYARGGIIVGVEQPPLERLIRLSIAKRLVHLNDERSGADEPVELVEGGDAAEEGPDDEEELIAVEGEPDATYIHLVVEIMGRHSNLILVDDEGHVMESAKHVTPRMSRVRPVRPKLPYTAPPPLDKPDPRRLTADAARELLDSGQADENAAKFLVKRFRGVSPQLAREVAFRARGATDVTVREIRDAGGYADLARITRALYEPMLTSSWEPVIYTQDDAVIGFSPVRLEHLAAMAEEDVVTTISEAADRAEAALGPGTPVDHQQRRQRLLDSIHGARDRVDARVASLEAQEIKAAEAEQLRTWGELIYAYLWRINSGDAQLDADGDVVPLDPDLSPKENAQRYFERYRKAQGASARLPDLEERAYQQLAYLDQLRTLVQQATGFAEIEALAHEWESQAEAFGLRPRDTATKKGGQRKSAFRRPKAVYDADGHGIYIGHSGRQNDQITFDIAGADDTWLHARGVPGSHVVVKWRVPMPEENESTIMVAAALAAHYSAARDAASVEVDVTRRRHVRKIKGGGPGLVTYRQERTIAVRPRDEQGLADQLREGGHDSRVSAEPGIG